MTKEIPKLEYGSVEWERRANNLARMYAPTIYACRKCTHPVAHGYCCGTCGTGSPETTQAEDNALEAKYAARKR